MIDKISDHAASYDFVKLGNEMADTLMRAAEEQVVKAQTMMDQTKALVEIIHNQVMAQAKSSEDMNARFKQVGSIMLDAHRILNGDIAANTGSMAGIGRLQDAPAPLSDPARLRALDALKHGRLDPAGIGTLDPSLTTDPRRAGDSARPDGLPRPMADLERFRVNRADPGANRRDPGVGSKQADRD